MKSYTFSTPAVGALLLHSAVTLQSALLSLSDVKAVDEDTWLRLNGPTVALN